MSFVSREMLSKKFNRLIKFHPRPQHASMFIRDTASERKNEEIPVTFAKFITQTKVREAETMSLSVN